MSDKTEKPILEVWDPEDVYDFFTKIEKSFQIQFEENDFDRLYKINTDETLTHTQNKILDIYQKTKSISNECTSQQAFYKLREAISVHFDIPKNNLSPKTSLKSLFAGKDNLLYARKLEHKLGFELNILESSVLACSTLFLAFLVGLIILFFNVFNGLFFWAIGTFLFWIMPQNIKNKTLGEVAQMMTQENYILSKRNADTFNPKEIFKILEMEFMKFKAISD